MKVVLTSIDSKYIHSPLAMMYLYAQLKAVRGMECVLIEKTIHDMTDRILADVLKEKPDVVCFSVYIWNVEIVRSIIKNIKKIDASVRIILGGPEVSFELDSEDPLKVCSEYIIKGEGDEALPAYLLNDDKSDRYHTVKELDSIISPYDEKMLERMRHKMIYYESSRGCPFECTYCLSSTVKGVRYFSMERVKEDLRRILSAGTKIIKFTDRTFNADKKRAEEIIRFLIKEARDTVIHFEIVPELLDTELLELLNSSKKGMFRVEAGIQSTNEKTLKEIKRTDAQERAFKNIDTLIKGNKVHVHLDLIFGLPYEDIEIFKRSFNDTYTLRPHELQLGFLKMLKGTDVDPHQKHGYIQMDAPPYEILGNSYVSYGQLVQIKEFEAVFSRLFDSKLFVNTLQQIEHESDLKPFDMYLMLTEHFKGKGFFDRKISYRELADILYDFGTANDMDLRDAIVMDHLLVNSRFCLSQRFRAERNIKPEVLELIAQDERISARYPGRAAAYIMKKISFYPFKDAVGIFFHEPKDALTGHYESVKIPQVFLV